MEAKDTTIGQLFGGLDRYEVPAYQRPYVWTAERQWEPLWDDIERISDRRLRGDRTGDRDDRAVLGRRGFPGERAAPWFRRHECCSLAGPAAGLAFASMLPRQSRRSPPLPCSGVRVAPLGCKSRVGTM